MGDLKSKRLIVLKGLLFLLLGVFASGLLLLHAPTLKVAILLVISIWAFCRFYYFAFYVIEKYVDSEFRFSGLYDFICYLMRRDLPK